MSCSSCCCVTPQKLLNEVRTRKKRSGRDAARLVREEDVKEDRSMDVSVLREQYRRSRESQRRRTQVLLYRRVSQELSDAVSIIPVPQGLTSSWEPQSCLPVAKFNPDLLTSDPWHVHLGLHRRFCRTREIHSETTNTNSSSRCSSSSSESDGGDRKLSGDSAADSLSRSRETWSSSKNDGDVIPTPLRASPDLSKKNPSGVSEDDRTDASNSRVCSAAASVKKNEESVTGNGALWDSRKSSTPALRFTRQMSFGGMGSSLQHGYYPFPQRKTPRISEAARRLGLYSSF
ncbi:hypothetical protein LDENG_00111910 [Lucifuga dentata]|nr:hypothetical protein LDENG_00111910 [Lucifuga dentata]